jgi:hypothetical protein
MKSSGFSEESWIMPRIIHIDQICTRTLCSAGRGLREIPPLDDGQWLASKSTAKPGIVRETLQMSACPLVLFGAGFEGELKRKADFHRFQIERRLKAFNGLLAQIGEGVRAAQACTV